MALGKYSKVDGRKSSSSYCSTVTLVAFVALCLVGVWMMTSSSAVPFQNADVTTQGNNVVTPVESESKLINDSSNENSTSSAGTPAATKEINSKQFEDNPGDLPEAATKVDNNTDENAKENIQVRETTPEEEKQEEKPTPSQDATRTEIPKDMEKIKDEASKTDDRDSKAAETRSDSEGRNPGAKQENREDWKEATDRDTSDADKKIEEKNNNASSNEMLPSGAQSEILNETSAQNGSFSTQATESRNAKEGHKSAEPEQNFGYQWKLCNVTAGSDYIPCLDNLQAIKSLQTNKHYEHRERHCPQDPPTCLVPLPEGYQRPIPWPTSREKIWYHNVPHTKLASFKGHQNWVKYSGEYLTFPGGGTQFKRGAVHYIDFIQEIAPDIAWGNHSHVILDVGCGVASFGGFLFDKDVLTMSFAPKDEHEAQVQFALERGIPALSAVMGTQRLPFPGKVFDIVHCARCRVPWHIEGGKLLLELNRVLRPGGFFVWSATPIYKNTSEDTMIWEAMKNLTKSMCWEAKSISKEDVNRVGVAVYQKPTSNECYEGRLQNEPPLCNASDDPNAAWKIPLQPCMHKIPIAPSERGSQWPQPWPSRMATPPYWLLSSQVGVYGKPAPEDFTADLEHWKRVVTKSYVSGLGINWSMVRNVMDMRAVYGGFAAALKDMNVWVMNVVSVDSPDTLPIIYERGLFGIYHDWCESFSTYPRTYDLLHADHLFSKIKKKCNMVALVVEVDRLLRPYGTLIVRDDIETMNEVEKALRSMHWEVGLTYSKDKEGLMCLRKTMWRPDEFETLTYAIG